MTNFGRDVFIPLDLIIGGPERIGQGWKMLVSALAAVSRMARTISSPLSVASIGTVRLTRVSQPAAALRNSQG